MPRDHRPLLLGDAEGLHGQKNIFAAFIPESKSLEPPSDAENHAHDGVSVPETSRDGLGAPETSIDGLSVPAPEAFRDGLALPEASKNDLGASEPSNDAFIGLGPLEPFCDDLVGVVDPSAGGLGAVETSKDGLA